MYNILVFWWIDHKLVFFRVKCWSDIENTLSLWKNARKITYLWKIIEPISCFDCSTTVFFSSKINLQSKLLKFLCKRLNLAKHLTNWYAFRTIKTDFVQVMKTVDGLNLPVELFLQKNISNTIEFKKNFVLALETLNFSLQKHSSQFNKCSFKQTVNYKCC